MLSNEKMKSLVKLYAPYLFLGIAMLIYHLQFSGFKNDDLWFREQLHQFSMSGYLIHRWDTWTSRLVIEFFLVLVSRMPFMVFLILNIAMCMLLLETLVRLCNRDRKPLMTWGIVCFILLYSFNDMSSAGWIATSMNYLWPLTLGLFSFIPIYKYVNEERIRFIEYPLYMFALLYGANAEQMSAVIFAVYGCFLIYLLYQKKVEKFFIVQMLLSFISLVLILWSPGNDMRNVAEIPTWFADYGMLSLIQKLQLGVSNCLSAFIYKPNLMFLAFSFLLFILIWKKEKQMAYRIIGAVPLVISFIFGYLGRYLVLLVPSLQPMLYDLTRFGYITLENSSDLLSYIPVMLLGLVFICILLSFYILYEFNFKFFFFSFIAVIGLATGTVSGFSPTVWASGARIFIYLYFAFAYLGILLFKDLISLEAHRKNQWIIFAVLGILVVMNYRILIVHAS